MTTVCSACELRASRCSAGGEAGHGAVELGRERLDCRAVDHQLAHQVQQLIEPLGVDPHRHRMTGSGRQPLARRCVRRLECRQRQVRQRDAHDVADRRGGRLHRVVVGQRRDPRLDPQAFEAIDAFGRRDAADQLAMGGERVEQHERTHTGHRRAVGQLGDEVDDAAAAVALGGKSHDVRQRDVALAGELLRRRALACEPVEPRDEHCRLEVAVLAGGDRLDRVVELVETGRQHVGRLVRETLLAAAQPLEHVLHRMRERGDRVEAHRRAHALERVRDAKDPLDRLAVLGRRLDPHDREPQLLQVLACLGEEDPAVLVRVDHPTASAAIASGSSDNGNVTSASCASTTARPMP